MSDLRRVDPESLVSPRGYSHGILAEGGRLLFVAGQIGCGPDGKVRETDLAAQFDLALRNVAEVVHSAGGAPDRIARMTIYTTDLAGYRSRLEEMGKAWRRVMGSHYPAMALVEVKGLFDDGAKIELEATAVL